MYTTGNGVKFLNFFSSFDRRKSEQRSKDSLQKNQVRKDYENLTKELDELCKEENRLRAFAMVEFDYWSLCPSE